MKKTIFFSLTVVFTILTGCWKMPAPGDGEVSMSPPEFSVEFISEPLDQTLGFDPWGLKKPCIAVGDITGDGQPEVILTRGGWVPSTREGDPEDLFYGHPVTFSWNGKSFERLEADWVGITSYSETSPVYRVQGTPRVLMIADIDDDGMNEVIVGTMPYRDASQRGAVYVFQWDGTRFVAEFSDYCMGGVQRLDLIDLGDENLVVISAVMRPVLGFGRQIDANICPQLRKGPEEPDTGLYVLHAIGANGYESQPLSLDHSSLTAFVTTSNHPFGNQLVRTSEWPSSTPVMLDWDSAQTIQYDGQVSTDDVQIAIDVPVLQIESADIDGDNSDEIVVLAAKGWDSSGLVSEDELIWQVFQITEDRYNLVYEKLAVFSSDLVHSPSYFFTVGDIDNDGRVEVIDSTGTVHRWITDRLLPQMNLIEAVGESFHYGLENIYIGDIYGDGRNRVIFTGRCFSPGEMRCNYPRMYVVSASLDSSIIENP
jgi:hypothetical protein